MLQHVHTLVLLSSLNRERTQYLRGEAPGSAEIAERGAIDEYSHSYFEDIEAVYRDALYSLETEQYPRFFE